MQIKPMVLALGGCILGSGIGMAQAATVASNNANHSFDTAMVIPDGFFTTIVNGAIELSDVLPNASIVAFSSGPYDYYSFTTTVAGTIILDIDFTYEWSGNPGSFDPEVAIWTAAGTLIAENDDRGSIDVGSAHDWDSYLYLPDMAAGTYVIGVAKFEATGQDGGWMDTSAVLPENAMYTLHVSAPVPEAETWALMLTGLGLLGVMARRRVA